ncbi:hypothetical protein DV735_g5686, partial [Chaetothyriales sp. CBS 134920]
MKYTTASVLAAFAGTALAHGWGASASTSNTSATSAPAVSIATVTVTETETETAFEDATETVYLCGPSGPVDASSGSGWSSESTVTVSPVPAATTGPLNPGITSGNIIGENSAAGWSWTYNPDEVASAATVTATPGSDGSGSGSGSGNGSGSNSGAGTGSGSGSDNGNGSDNGSGSGTGTGTGAGTGADGGSGAGTSSGTDNGNGNGSGSSTSPDTGSGNGNGSGSGTSTSPGTGSGNGTSPSTGGGNSTSPSTGSGNGTSPGTGSGNSTSPGTGTGNSTSPGTGTGNSTSPGTGTGNSTIPGTGNSTLPETGTSNSSSFPVTAAFPRLNGSTCNDANSRSQWCGGFDLDTDYYTTAPDTGVICKYDWTITNTTLNFDGVDRLALAINGQVPGPLIECNWGDTLEVSVTNQLQDNSTTIHWHGIWHLGGTNDQDGVPGVSECAIAPGTTRVYKFPLKQYGTGWYHSHALTQLGDGIRGPLVIHGPASANYDIDSGTILIDDVFGDASVPLTAAQYNWRIAHNGPGPTFNYLLNGANTLPDLSAGKHALWKLTPGKKHRFRIINSSSQNQYAVHFDNHTLTVIATDYVAIEPYETEWLNIALGQRYDVIVEANQPVGGYFLRAVTQTSCPSASVNDGLGSANGILLYDGAPTELPTTTAGKTIADFAYCLDEPAASLRPHLVKSAGSATAFSASASSLPGGNVAQVQTSDDGRVFRWFLNNGAINVNYTQPTLQTLAETGDANSSLISNPIVLTQKDEWHYFVIENQFFASHPMHLHGHDLSLLGQGTTPWSDDLVNTLNFENPPRRDSALLVGSAGVGIAPGYTVIGFQSDNPGAWLMHCHIVWHVDGGLALQWLERPSEIPASQYVNKAEWQNECAGEVAYEAADPRHIKTTSDSGLKRRSPYFDDLLNARSDNVVRLSEGAERRYIDHHARRGLGDGFKARHNSRR